MGRKFQPAIRERAASWLILVGVLFWITPSGQVKAQSLKDLEKWSQSVEQEIPDLEFSTLRSGSRMYNLIRYNLLSDKYFIPVFGKSFDQLPESKRVKIESKIRKYGQSRLMDKQSNKYPWARRLNFYLMNAFKQSYAYDQAASEVQSLRELRKEYNQLLQEIESDRVSFNQLTDHRASLMRKYSTLLPSEAQHLSQELEESINEVASRSLMAKAKEIDKLDNTFTALQKIESFQRDNRPLYSESSQEVKSEVNDIVTSKNNSVVSNLAEEENNRISNLKFEIRDIDNVNRLWTDLNSSFGRYRHVPPVSELFDLYKRKKADLITSNAGELTKKVQTSSSIQELDKLVGTYLQNVNTNSQVTNLLQLVENRKNSIEAYAKQQERIALGNFSANGLQYEKLIKDIYLGNFIDIPFNRDEMKFAMLLNSYITSYSDICENSLPPDKIELTRQECATERVRTNGFGVEVSRYCVSWRTIKTGYYASPKMYQAKMMVDGLQASDSFRNMFRILLQKNPLASTVDMATEAIAVKNDMSALIRMNGCDSPEIKKFQENLRLFAFNRQPVSAASVTTRLKANNVSDRNQDFAQLVDDLVKDNSSDWVMNKYNRGSVHDIKILSKDAQNRPKKLSAKYEFFGLNGQSTGSVTMTFKDGLPDCMYFFDFPSTCRTPNRRIVADYANGKYTLE